MLKRTLVALEQGRVILASGSPRRHDIIKQWCINAEIIPSTFDENLDRSNYESHGEYVQDLAWHKVQEVYDRLKDDSVPPALIIGADTLVTLDNVIYGKPKDNAEAFQVLSRLANKEHIVYTGVCLKTPKKEIIFYDSTRVKFGDISDEQIHDYVNTGECLDKAGGYAVQGIGGSLIERINGDFFTVTGLPSYLTIYHLNKIFSNA